MHLLMRYRYAKKNNNKACGADNVLDQVHRTEGTARAAWVTCMTSRGPHVRIIISLFCEFLALDIQLISFDFLSCCFFLFPLRNLFLENDYYLL